MKVLISVLSVLALGSAQQLINPYFNEGLLPYNDWQPNVPYPYAVPQLLTAPGVQLPPVPVPFPAQFPYTVPNQPAQYPIQVPFPIQQQPQQAVFPFNNIQLPPQMQLVRHGLPHSDAAAVSYSSLHYSNNPQASTGVVSQPPVTLQAPAVVGVPTAPSGGVNAANVGPVAPATPTTVVKDIASFSTEYGTGSDKSPVARYEAINAGSVHVAPLPGHTVDQKLIAPGTNDQKL